jgi:uncharacterized membrane protein
MAQQVQSSVVVQVPVEKVYDYWKTLENLPRFMRNIEEVTPSGNGTTHWRVRGPLGAKIEYDARTTRNEPNKAIAWNTVEGGDVQTSGQVRFEELGQERTRVEVTMNYFDVPGGAIGEAASKVVSNPQVMLDQDLRNFKDIMEGTVTPEEVQERMAAADAQSGLVAFLTSGAGLAVVGGGLLLFLLLRRRGRRKKSRIIFEF